MADDALDELRRLVVDDPPVRARLLSMTDQQTFAHAVAEIAREHDIHLDAEAVTAALLAARREHLERWV